MRQAPGVGGGNGWVFKDTTWSCNSFFWGGGDGARVAVSLSQLSRSRRVRGAEVQHNDHNNSFTG